MDNLTKKQRSLCMSNIRSKNTKPEMLVRKALTAEGIHYRLHNSMLPGKPDIIIPKLDKTIFINGCFWHQHKNCKYKSMPKTNYNYWKSKLERNSNKQTTDINKLKNMGWKVCIVWECQTKTSATLNKALSKIIN